MINRQKSYVAVTLAVATLLSGCATGLTGNADQPEVAAAEPATVEQRLDSYIVADDVVRHDVTDQDVARLWQEYNIMRRSGNSEEAKAKLEEAIAITPNDPALWSGAAELELEEESHLRAENYAAKSNFLSNEGNISLRYRNWLIIQRAREARGDLLGAREAEIESGKLR